eukprot:58344_1
MSEAYITTTQQIFENVITKPKLVDKYLRRPPFRFIHDIVINTMKSTGFPEGLFEGNELIGKLIKDKQDKISWLNKLIECIQSVTNETIQANPNKIVAGLDAEYTNLLLQTFGQIAIKVANGELSMHNILNHNSEANDDKSESIENAKPSPPKPQPQLPSSAHQSSASNTHRTPKDDTSRSNDQTNDNDTEQWVTETQQSLGKLIERPRLLTKLLKRPPFRFLHDIVKSLIKSTGYPLQFVDEEKDITNADIKDGKFKYYFLSKLIVIVSATIDEDLSFVDPKNIIAGRNPQDTNCLLSKLGYAASLEVDVDQIKNKMNTFRQNIKSKKQNKEKKTKEENRRKQSANVGKNTARKAAPVMPKLELEQLERNKPIKPSAELANVKQLEKKEAEKPFEAIQRLQRPRTARRAPPKLKSNVIEQKEKDVKNDFLIMDDTGGDDNENEMDDVDTVESVRDMMMINKTNEDTELERLGFVNKANNERDLVHGKDDGKHGKLVRDILDAQNGIKLETMRLGTHRRGDSAKSVGKVENMREMIQKLCQTCLPLTKCIDLVFEDIEAINNQILKWKQQIAKHQTELVQEKEKTNQLLSPLHEELEAIDQQIKKQNQLILEKHAVLLKNEVKTNDIIRKRLLNE